MIDIIEQSERATLIEPREASAADDLAPFCECGAQLFSLGDRWQCVACHRMRPKHGPAAPGAAPRALKLATRQEEEAEAEAEAIADDMKNAAEEWQIRNDAALAELADAIDQPISRPTRRTAFRCPECGSRMPFNPTPAGEAAYQCSNPYCKKTISAASADHAAERLAA